MLRAVMWIRNPDTINPDQFDKSEHLLKVIYLPANIKGNSKLILRVTSI